MRVCLLFLILMIVLCGCYVDAGARREQLSQRAFVKENNDNIRLEDELFASLSRPIASRYYDYRHKPIVRVFIGQFSSDIVDDGLIKSYVGYYLEERFKKSSQFNLLEILDDSVDCYIEGNMQTINKDKFRVIFDVYDNKNIGKVAEISKIYDYRQMDSEEFVVFKAKHQTSQETKKNIGDTRLVVAINATGKSLDTYETTYRSTYRSSSEYSGAASGSYRDSNDYNANVDVNSQSKGSSQTDFSVQEKSGRVGAYPSEISVFVNGRSYKPNSYGVAYDQNIYPGEYDIIVSFRETFWDSARLSEIKGKKHEKKFRLQVLKDKYMSVNVTVAYDGRQVRIDPEIAVQ